MSASEAVVTAATEVRAVGWEWDRGCWFPLGALTCQVYQSPFP